MSRKPWTWILALFALASCGRRTYQESIKDVKTDSVVLRVEKVTAPLLRDVLKVPGLCPDSAVAREFKKIYIRDTDTLLIEIRDNALVIENTQKARVISELRERVEKQTRALEQSKTTNKTRINWRAALALGGVIMVFILFPAIPKTINRFLKMLLI